jgi:hypothetical protein
MTDPNVPEEERVDADGQATESVAWMVGQNRVTNLVFIALSNGQRIDFPAADAAYMAAALQEYEDDETTRAHVAEEWGPMW